MKNKRSVFYLFGALLISSVVIGSFCKTEFKPLPETYAASMALAEKDNEKYPPVDVDMTLKQVGEHSWYVQGKSGIATDNKGFISNAGVVITNKGVVIFDASVH